MTDAPPIPMPYLPIPELSPAPEMVQSAVTTLQSACGPWTPARSKSDSQYSMQTGVCDVVLGRQDAEYLAFSGGIMVGVVAAVIVAFIYKSYSQVIRLRANSSGDRIAAYFGCVMLGGFGGFMLAMAGCLSERVTNTIGDRLLFPLCMLVSIGALCSLRAVTDRTDRA